MAKESFFTIDKSRFELFVVDYYLLKVIHIRKTNKQSNNLIEIIFIFFIEQKQNLMFMMEGFHFQLLHLHFANQLQTIAHFVL